MHLFVQATIVGILFGGVYALIASGQAIIFGVTRTINFAQAILAILCSYLSYTLFTDFGIDPFLSMLVLVPAMFAFGYAIYVLLLRRLTRSSAELGLLVLYGLGIGIQGVLDFIYKTNNRVITPGYANDSWTVADYQIPEVRFFGFVLAVAVLATLHLIRQRTKLGRALRATTQNPVAARLLGVDVERVSAVGMGLGVAAVILGVVESVVAATISPDWSAFSFLVVLFAVLIVRPQGLFGHRLRGAL